MLEHRVEPTEQCDHGATVMKVLLEPPLWRVSIGLLVVCIVASACHGQSTAHSYASVEYSLISFRGMQWNDPREPSLLMTIADNVHTFIVDDEASELPRPDVERALTLLEPLAGNALHVKGKGPYNDPSVSNRLRSNTMRDGVEGDGAIYSLVDEVFDVNVELVMYRDSEVMRVGRHQTAERGQLWHLSIHFGASQDYVALDITAEADDNGNKRIFVREMSGEHGEHVGNARVWSRRDVPVCIVTVTSAADNEEGETVVRTVAFALNQSSTDLTVMLEPETFQVADLAFSGDALTIMGSTRTGSVLDGSGMNRIFNVHSGLALALSDMTLSNGRSFTTAACIFVGGSGEGGSLTLDSVTITNCLGYNAGGAIHLGEGVSFSATNCEFSALNADRGGVVWTQGGSVNIVNSLIRDVTVDTAAVVGGRVDAGEQTSSIVNCTIYDVTVDDDHIRTGIVQTSGSSSWTLSHVILVSGMVPYVAVHPAGITAHDIVVRSEVVLYLGVFHARNGALVVERVFVGSRPSERTLVPGIVGRNVVCNDVVLRGEYCQVQVDSTGADGSFTGTGLVRDDDCQYAFSVLASTNSVTFDVDLLSSDVCTNRDPCLYRTLLLNMGASVSGSMRWNGNQYNQNFATAPFEPVRCESGAVLCGNGVFEEIDGDCEYPALNAYFLDCNGVMDGGAFVE